LPTSMKKKAPFSWNDDEGIGNGVNGSLPIEVAQNPTLGADGFCGSKPRCDGRPKKA